MKTLFTSIVILLFTLVNISLAVKPKAVSPNDVPYTVDEIRKIRALPWRRFNRMVGELCDIKIPVYLRKYIHTTVSDILMMNMNESLHKDFRHFSTINELFTREIDPQTRPLNQTNCLVSPGDGTVEKISEIQSNFMFNIKNVSYSIEELMGPVTWKDLTQEEQRLDYVNKLKHNKENKIYHVNLFINTDEYHRYHSPTDWKILFRRHIAGELLDFVADYIPSVYTYNERVVLHGKWKHGFFGMIPIGGLLVGSIHIYKDRSIVTNSIKDYPGTVHEKYYEPPLTYMKAESLGQFNFGSAIILVFEAPANIVFHKKQNDAVKFGEKICTFTPVPKPEPVNPTSTYKKYIHE